MPGLSRDEVIAAIYAAASEPDGLSRIATTLRDFLDVDSAGVWLIDRGQITELSQTADIIDSIKPYLDYFYALDPWTASRKMPGRAYLGSDSVNEDELLESEFYRDFARHYGMLRPLGIVFNLEPGRIGTIALNRTATRKLLNGHEKGVLQDLALHLRTALTLRTRFSAERDASLARSAALNAVSYGVVLCNADALVRDINEAALALDAARRGIVLKAPGPTLHAATPSETAELHGLIRSGVAGMPGAMRLRGADGGHVSVIVTPVSERVARVDKHAPLALLYLRRDDAAPRIDAPTLMRLFGLSPAQAGLAVLLVAGRTFEEAAAERKIAATTARSHYLAILNRTGAKNLRDLLRLLNAIPG